MKITAPSPDEYAPFYTDYVQRAAARMDVTAALAIQPDEIRSALGALSDSQARFKPAPGEWSIKEVVSHLIDAERVFSYRFLRVSRKDKTPLPGFEQEDFVREANADDSSFADLLDEFEFLRRANILAVKNTRDSGFAEIGTASGTPISARALIYIIVGHVEHHMESLNEKYLPFTK
jgi:hypothetical protein